MANDNYLTSVAASRDWIFSQLDVKNAFLSGEFAEVYIMTHLLLLIKLVSFGGFVRYCMPQTAHRA